MHNLIILNTSGHLPTFQLGDRSGFPDLSCSSVNVHPLIHNWTVIDTLQFGDHRPIQFQINELIPQLPKRRFRTKDVPISRFLKATSQHLTNDHIDFNTVTSKHSFDETYDNFLKLIKQNADKLLKKRNSTPTPKITWWSPHLRAQRNKLAALYKLQKNPNSNENLKQNYKKERARYKKAILKAKQDAWTQMCRRETNPFGLVKRLAFNDYMDTTLHVLSSTTSPQTATRLDILTEITTTLFGPSLPNTSHRTVVPITTELPFTKKEIQQAIFSFNRNKAPGPDELDHYMIRGLFNTLPHLFVSMYNKLLQQNYFPTAWKMGELVYFKKQGKPEDQASSFRPITLLPILGKVFEKLLLKRIHFHLNKIQNNFSNKQHGFMELRSTETALLQIISRIKLNKENKHYTSLISIDFKGAFDHLPWALSLESLKTLQVPQQLINIISSFLEDRSAQVHWTSPETMHFFTRGCPQGSCLGPFLWLSLLETLLVRDFGPWCSLVAYADDVIILVWGPSRAHLEREGNNAIKIFESWALENEIEISIDKSLALTFGKPRPLQRAPIYKISNHNIKEGKTLKYLGVVLDRSLSFLPHLQEKKLEIMKITQNLYKFSSLSGRLPQQFFKVWYITILQRKLAYACGVWFPHMWPSHGGRALLSIQRKILLLASRAYSKTSTSALLTLTGLPPLTLDIEREAHIAATTRFGISMGSHFAPKYMPKISKHIIDPSWQGPTNILTSEFIGDIHIFTDGSKTDQGTGAGFSAYLNQDEIYAWKHRLADENSVFQAELFAILNALKWAESTNYTSFLISSDSLSSLVGMQNSSSQNLMITEIQQFLISSDKNYFFNWVKGHAGIVGNERADELAGEAARDESLPIAFIPLPISSFKNNQKIKMLQLWQDQWDAAETGRYTYQFFPKVNKSTFLQHRSLYIFFSNHGPFQSYLYKIGKRSSPLCVCGQLSNSLHYVLDCPLTPAYHIKKHSSMNFADWTAYVLDRPTLIRRIIQCMTFVEKNEFMFQNTAPRDRFPATDLSDDDSY